MSDFSSTVKSFAIRCNSTPNSVSDLKFVTRHQVVVVTAPVI
jgi:hypothetical protein